MYFQNTQQMVKTILVKYGRNISKYIFGFVYFEYIYK